MYNLLIALAVALVAFPLGRLAGSWTYGFAPAMLVFPIAWFLLARRTGKQVEAIFKRAMDEISARRIDEGKEVLMSALPLGRWQFLVAQQVYAQLGALEYVQRNYSAARPLLEQSWSRNWQAMALLALLDLRDGKPELAVSRLRKSKTFGGREPLLWAVLAWIHLQSNNRDAALATVGEGLVAIADNKALKELRLAIANDQLKKFDWPQQFGTGWYQFFPDQVPAVAAARQITPPPPKGAFGRGGKTWPAPRR